MDLHDISQLAVNDGGDPRERVRMLTERLPDDCEVYLQGLTTNAEHNNKLGVIKCFDGERYTVSVVEAGVSILVEPCNVKVQKTFEPQLFVRISAKDFTQPKIARVSKKHSLQEKMRMYYHQCSLRNVQKIAYSHRYKHRVVAVRQNPFRLRHHAVFCNVSDVTFARG